MVDKMSNWRKLCAELLQGLDENRHPEVRYPGHLRLVMAATRAALAAEPPAPADSQPTHSQYFSSHHAIAGEVVKILEDAGLAGEPPAPAPTINDIFELCEDHEFHLGGDGADEEESAESLLQIILVALTRWGNQPPALLRQPAPAPVPVAERPWERDGWCTDWGWCWVFVQGRWLRDYPQNYLNAVCLPHWAIFQPPQGGEVAK